MFEFNPFISNDGSVGLYSKKDNDIYHSVYGALSESWEKFVIPAEIDKYLKKDKNLKVLDICYGIGYNTKTLIQYIINNIDLIHTDKNFLNKEGNFSDNNYSIHTDKKSILSKLKNYEEINTQNNYSIHTDKTNKQNSAKSKNINIETIDNDNICSRISVDSVEIDKNLVMLSPFIKNKYDYKNLLDIDLEEVKKLREKKIKPDKIDSEHLISNDVLRIIFDRVVKSGNIDFEFLDRNLSKYRQFFSKDIINLYKLYKKVWYINKHKPCLLTFLHNIYYHHISKRYIKGLKTPYNSIFDMNIICNDIISFLLGSDKIYDIVFLDAFTPAKCPKLWTLDFFKLLYEHLDDDGKILTYSTSAQIRNAFINSGFYIGKIYSEKYKRYTGTIAVKNKELIKEFLSEYEDGLLKTKAGIYFRDENFINTPENILKRHQEEFNNSNLISSSKYKKNFEVFNS